MKSHRSLTLLSLALILFGCAPQDTRDPLHILAEEGDAQAQFEWAERLQESDPAPADRD